MTSYVVNTYLQDVTQDLTGDGDDLLVTSAGSLVETPGELGVNSIGDSELITIDGLVYSADSELGTAVYITGNATTLFVNGQVQGDSGVDVVQRDGHDDFVNVGSQGSIESVSSGESPSFSGKSSSPAVTDDSLSNAGDISSGSHRRGCGVGRVRRRRPDQQQRPDFGSIAIDSSTAMSQPRPSRTPARSKAGAHRRVLFFDDLSGTTSTIDNEGTITGSGFVIFSALDILDINNSGTIYGGLYSPSKVDVENSGHWHDGTGSGGVVFSLSGADNSLTNSQAGTITGSISIGRSGDTIDNAGRIDGAITLLAGATCSPTRARSTGRSRSPAAGTANTFEEFRLDQLAT